jgi:carbon storage regulator
MLVLSRKKGESIILAGSIVVTVVKVERGAVRLGITAPADVRVFREEVVNRTRGVPAAGAPVETGP